MGEERDGEVGSEEKGAEGRREEAEGTCWTKELSVILSE